MASKIILKKSNVASKVPAVGDLDYGELALNYTDGKLWYKNNSNVITQLNASTGGATSWSKKIANYTAVSGDRLICDTSGGSFNITLPATPATGDYVELTDGSDWFTTNLTVLRNGSTIEGATNDVLLNVKGITVYFVYDGTTWQVTATLGKQGVIDTSTSLVFTAPQSFTASGILLKGTSTGYTTFASANTTTTAYTVTFPAETMTVGYKNIPPVGTKTSSYTLALGDVGKYVQVSTGGSITIPDAVFAEGDIISIFNNTSAAITITCTITTAYIAGTDADKATVSLATRGIATILFISGTTCVISGNVS